MQCCIKFPDNCINYARSKQKTNTIIIMKYVCVMYDCTSKFNPVSFVYGGIGSGNGRTTNWRFCISVKNDVYFQSASYTTRCELSNRDSIVSRIGVTLGFLLCWRFIAIAYTVSIVVIRFCFNSYFLCLLVAKFMRCCFCFIHSDQWRFLFV